MNNDPTPGRDKQDDPDLEELQGLLDQMAAEEEELMREALADDPAPHVERVAQILAAARATDATAAPESAAPDADAPAPAGQAPTAPVAPGRSALLRLAPLLAVAAALLLGFFLTRDDEQEPTPGPGSALLGQDSARLLHPVGNVGSAESLTSVRWDFPRAAPAWTYRARLIDPTLSGQSAILAASVELGISSWLVPPSRLSAPESWPARVIIEVQAFAGGELQDTLTHALEFSSP